jgi:hypothetical protein
MDEQHISAALTPEAVSLAQGGFYVATGLWPILHLPSFEAVSGPKPEGWLVKTFGGFISVVGGALALAGMRRRVTPELALLGAGAAAALAAADIIYVGKRRIAPTYLLDAAAELLLLGAWGLSRPLRRG